jgi:hypothetical protein
MASNLPRKNYLLLTSTIQPKSNQPQLAVTDAAVRFQEYRHALRFYVNELNHGTLDGLIYADNSGYDLAELKAEFSHPQIEWVSFYDLDYPPNYHRGYGEFRLIDRVMNQSQGIADLRENDVIWKITGRYILSNLRRMVALSPTHFDIYCHATKKWAEMSMMAWSRQGYHQLLEPTSQKFATGLPPELILAQDLRHSKTPKLKIVTTLRWPMRLIGRRGSDGSPYQGRWTPVKHFLLCSLKAVSLPFSS